MIHAYDEIYLDDAMEALGGAVEYATLSCKIGGQEFIDLFVASGVASEFGRASKVYFRYVQALCLQGWFWRNAERNRPALLKIPYIDYPPEYWVGWILAILQWNIRQILCSDL